MSRAKELYRQLYRLFDDCTPLSTDCGQCCHGACCTEEGGDGMFLYPGEEELLQSASFLTLQKSSFRVNGKPVTIALCEGRCDRALRPLACRIFPLFPYVKPGSRPVVFMDPRAGAICPVARVMQPSELEPQFVRRVNRTALLLHKFEQSRIFMEEQSNLLDELCGSYEILRKILSE